jgi:hypothetical protein
MDKDKLVAVVLKQIDDRVALLTEALAAGRPDDYASYKKICGEIQGMQTVRLYIVILTKDTEFEDE